MWVSAPVEVRRGEKSNTERGQRDSMFRERREATIRIVGTELEGTEERVPWVLFRGRRGDLVHSEQK